MKERIKNLYWRLITTQTDGIGVIEIILILVIIIGLVLIFREKITELVNEIFSTITDNTTDVLTQ